MDRWSSRWEWVISIHALREEGDEAAVVDLDEKQISIHALREEGDPVVFDVGLCILISIHALREEGDSAFRRAR